MPGPSLGWGWLLLHSGLLCVGGEGGSSFGRQDSCQGIWKEGGPAGPARLACSCQILWDTCFLHPIPAWPRVSVSPVAVSMHTQHTPPHSTVMCSCSHNTPHTTQYTSRTSQIHSHLTKPCSTPSSSSPYTAVRDRHSVPNTAPGMCQHTQTLSAAYRHSLPCKPP